MPDPESVNHALLRDRFREVVREAQEQAAA